MSHLPVPIHIFRCSFLCLSAKAKGKAVTGILSSAAPFLKPSVLFCFGCLLNRFRVRIRVILGLDKDQRLDRGYVGVRILYFKPSTYCTAPEKKENYHGRNVAISLVTATKGLSSSDGYRLPMLRSCNQKVDYHGKMISSCAVTMLIII